MLNFSANLDVQSEFVVLIGFGTRTHNIYNVKQLGWQHECEANCSFDLEALKYAKIELPTFLSNIYYAYLLCRHLTALCRHLTPHGLHPSPFFLSGMNHSVQKTITSFIGGLTSESHIWDSDALLLWSKWKFDIFEIIKLVKFLFTSLVHGWTTIYFEWI